MARSALTLAFVAMAGLALALPQAGVEEPIKPAVDNMTMHGPGCPIGTVGIVREFRDNIPVIAFPGWGLSLEEAEKDDKGRSVSKFCTEELLLSHVPAGKRLRIASVTVSGWADLKDGSSINIEVETHFGDNESGVSLGHLVGLFIGWLY
jgi:hypothetical protein